MEPQIALTMPLLEGTDGTRKMSKSYGNYIGLTDAPADMFGKTMSIPDEMIAKYYRLASSKTLDEVEAIEASLADGTGDPVPAQARSGPRSHHHVPLRRGRRGGRGRVRPRLQGEPAPRGHRRDLPDLAPGEDGTLYLAGLLKDAGLAPSAGEARRLIDGGGVKIDGEAVAPKSYNIDASLLKSGVVLQVGKRKFARLA